MKPFLIGLAALAAAGVGAAENAESIIKRFDSQKLAALQQYVQAHPDAPDAADATDAVIAGLLELDRENEAVPLLAKKYDRLSAQKEVPLPLLFGEVIAPLAQLYARTGQRAAGEAFLNRVKKDFAAHEQADQLTAVLAQLQSQFSVPQLGDRLEIKFTATDKREVDLAALKGKVVLVDFWASSIQRAATRRPAGNQIHRHRQTRGGPRCPERQGGAGGFLGQLVRAVPRGDAERHQRLREVPRPGI